MVLTIVNYQSCPSAYLEHLDDVLGQGSSRRADLDRVSRLHFLRQVLSEQLVGFQYLVHILSEGVLSRQGEKSFGIEGDHAFSPLALLSALELMYRESVIELMCNKENWVLHHVFDLRLLLLLTFHATGDLFPLGRRLQHEH